MGASDNYLVVASSRMITAAVLAALLSACGGGGGGSAGGGGNSGGGTPVTPPATPGVSLLAGYMYGNPYIDATGTAARFNQPGAFVVDSLNNIWVEDVDPSVNPSAGTGQETTLRVVSPAGAVTTVVRDARPTTPFNGNTYAGLVADGYGNVYEQIYSAYINTDIGQPILPTPLLGQPFSTLNPPVPAPNLPANRQCQGSSSAQTCFFAMNRQGTLFGIGTDYAFVAYSAGQPLVTLAHQQVGPWVDGGSSVATFDRMVNPVFDANNTGYFVDSYNPPEYDGAGMIAMRSFTQQGTFSTLTSSVAGYTDGGPGVAQVNFPGSLRVDAAGNVYFTDIKSSDLSSTPTVPLYIRKMTPAGVISTFAGPFIVPSSVASLTYDVDSNGNIYMFQQQQLLKVAPGGTPVAFAGLPYQTGSQDGGASQARFLQPLGVTTDTAGNTYVADCGANTVRKIDASGNTTTLAGSPGQGGEVDGVGSAARLTCPRGIVADGLGNVYVTQDSYVPSPGDSVPYTQGALRMINTTTGAVTTIVVTRALSATGLAIDASGKIYTNDLANNALRVYDPKANTLSFLAQGGIDYGFHAGAAPDGFGGLAVDATGNVYVINPGDGKLRKVDQQGNVTFLPGAGGTTSFPTNAGIAIDASGNLYVTDPLNHVIRKIATDGTMTVVAGSTNVYFSQTGALPASLGTPIGIAIRPGGTGASQFVVSDQNAILSVVLQ